MPQRPKKKSSFDKTISSYERKLERQRQMEKFEKVAAEDVPDDAGTIVAFFPPSDTGKKKPDPDGNIVAPKGAIENARKFLWDEDDDDYDLPIGGHSQSKTNANQYSGMNDSASSRASMFFAKTGIEQDSARLKDIRGFESPGMHDVNLNSSFRHRRGSLSKRQSGGMFAPIGACCSGCFVPCGTCSRRQKIVMVASLVFVVLAVAGAVIAVTVGFSFGSSNDSGSSQTSNPGGPDAEKEEFPIGHDRYEGIREYLINSGVTDESDLDDESTAQSKALWWVAVDDEAQLDIGSCQVLERYALATFFFSTFVGEFDEGGGMQLVPEWDKSKNWMGKLEVCKWHGVECAQSTSASKTGAEPVNDAHVIHLNLPKNSIQGSIPSEIAALQELKLLNLSGNKLHGSIPHSIGKLKHLAVLELQDNQLEGEIPAEMAECHSLRNVHLSDNNLSGSLAPELGSLAQLRTFNAGNNQLEGPIPHTINGWKSMRDFRVNNNQINGKIFQLSHVPTLEIVHIQDNKLTGQVPQAISKLANLREFRFNGNGFTGSVPDAVCGLNKAQVFAGDCSEDGGTIECKCCHECYPN